MINDLPNLEALRREPATMSRSPLTGEQAAEIPDYSDSLTRIGLTYQTLTESIENCQRERTEVSYKTLHEAVENLGKWLRARDFHV